MSFAGRLKISRKEKGYSQETLAEVLEVSRQSITKWETGSAFPELKKLLQLSVILDKDLDWLLCDERSKMITGRKPENRDKDNSRSIYDMKSLEEARWSRMISGILEYLDGMEFREAVEEERFSGCRTYVVFGSRMYLASYGEDPKTGAEEETFRELKPEEAADILLRQIRQHMGFTETGTIPGS